MSISRAGLCGICISSRGRAHPAVLSLLGTGHTQGVDTGPPFAVPAAPSRATRPNPTTVSDVLFHIMNDRKEFPTTLLSHKSPGICTNMSSGVTIQD